MEKGKKLSTDQNNSSSVFMAPLLQPAILRVPVTALSHALGLLLVGEGPYLRIFKSQDGAPLLLQRIFETQTIHGITTRATSMTNVLLVVWGGKHIRIVHLKVGADSTDHRNLDVSFPSLLMAPDRILDLAIAPVGSGHEHVTQVVLLTAHNALLSFELDLEAAGTQRVISLRPLTNGSRCILYAAHLLWTDTDSILVAAGTTFGEIIVWSADSLDAGSVVEKLYSVFTGHEGSIYGVHISHAMSLDSQSGHQRILASCSDDRTVRIWDLSGLANEAIYSDPSISLDAFRDRETGFGANIEEIHPSVDGRKRCLATAFGHLSRIWRVRFLRHDIQDRKIKAQLISVGEDSTCQLWHLESDEKKDPTLFSLRHVSTSGLHSGKNIWSISVLEDTENDLKVLTGGNDGAVIDRSFPSDKAGRTTSSSANFNEEWTVSQALKTAEVRIEDHEGFSDERIPETFVRSYSFIHKNEILTTTSGGHILRAKIDDHSSSKWTLFHQLKDLQGFSLCTSLASSQMAFIADSSGRLYCFLRNSPASLNLVKKFNGKVAAIFAQDITSPYGFYTSKYRSIALIVTLVGSQSAYLLSISADNSASLSNVRVEDFHEVELQHGFIVTSFVYVETICKFGRRHFVLGSRTGFISVWELSFGGKEPVMTLPHIHERESVTAMQWLETPHRISGHLISIGRNGTCCVNFLDLEHEKKETFITVHEAFLPFGPNIEGLFNDNVTGDIVAYGFHGKYFKAQSLNSERELVSIECGGAHRMWAFNPPKKGDDSSYGGTLVWTKAATLRICGKSRASHRIVQQGGHGREIKASAVSPMTNWLGSPIIATGAEDTDIKLFIPTQNVDPLHLATFERICTMRRHIAGIQCLKWGRDGSFLFSSGGCEQFYVWRIRDVPPLRVGVVCEAQCPIVDGVSDLRITDFDIWESEWNARSNDSYLFNIAMAFSDSTIRIYDYDSTLEFKEFALSHDGAYMTACITRIAFLSKRIIITASTNGHIAYWPILHSHQPGEGPVTIYTDRHHRVHQSTIKSLEHTSLDSLTDLILTTGDDNAIGFTLLSSDATTDFVDFETLLLPRAHAAAINDCALIPDGSAESNADHHSLFALTVAHDQRLKLWSVIVDKRKGTSDNIADRLNVELLQDVPSAVADVSCVRVYADQNEKNGTKLRVLVCGVGMEEWIFNMA